LDWVLLAFTDAAKSNDRGLSCAENWPDANPGRGTACCIIGYPGGTAGFEGHDHAKNDTVRPSLPFGRQLVAAGGNGVIEFQGSYSRAGMSGGGVFLVESESFIGLHRERDDPTQQIHAVSALQIRRVLKACGYEIVPRNGTGEGDSSSDLRVLDGCSPGELLAIAASLLKTTIADCNSGRRIELSIGSKGKLTLILSEFAADPMQRMAITNDMRLCETQESQIRHLEDLRATGAGGALNVDLLLQRAEAARDKTIKSIRDRVRLMVAGLPP
jgi:hypothetical protein